MAVKVEMYTKTVCPYCVRAKELLKMKGIDEIIEYNIETDMSNRKRMLERLPGARTVPQIFIDEVHVKGYDDIYAMEHEKEENGKSKLENLLKL